MRYKIYNNVHQTVSINPIQYLQHCSSASFDQFNKIFTRTLMSQFQPIQYNIYNIVPFWNPKIRWPRPLLREPHGGVGARSGWTPRRATLAGHGDGGGAVQGGGQITRCGRIRSGWRLGGRHRQVMAAESSDAGESARDGAPTSHDGRGNRWGRRHRQVTSAAARGVVAVEPSGAAAKSPDAGGSAQDGASTGHDGRGNRRGGRHRQVTATMVEHRAAGWWRWSRAGWRHE
jgi:hypothetical protein